MPREPRPWQRAGVGGAWYSTVGGEKVWLAPAGASRAEASAALARELAARRAGGQARRGHLTGRDLCNLYLADKLAAVKAGAYSKGAYGNLRSTLRPFAARFGSMQAADVTPAAVESWAASMAVPGASKTGRAWNTTTQSSRVGKVRAMYRWAKRAGHLAEDVMAGVRRPVSLVRSEIPTRAEVERLIAACPEPFAEFLTGLLLTGCRPGEVANLTADRVDLAGKTWQVLDKIRGKTGAKCRTVYLSDAAVELTRKMLAKHPEGHVFRNKYGRPWKNSGWSVAMKRHREKAGLGSASVPNALRHLYCTEKLEAGVPPATVAALMGHRSVTMVMTVYSKLAKSTDYLRDAANR